MGLLTSHHAPKSQPGGTAAQHLQSAPRAERGLCLLPQLSRYVPAAVRAAREALLSSLPSWRERAARQQNNTGACSAVSWERGRGSRAAGKHSASHVPRSSTAFLELWEVLENLPVPHGSGTAISACKSSPRARTPQPPYGQHRPVAARCTSPECSPPGLGDPLLNFAS